MLVLLFMGYAFTCAVGLSYQLDVVDASLLELLQSPFGLFLQWECKTLESLCTFVQAKLHGDLPDRKNKQMAKPKRAETKWQNSIWEKRPQTRARAVGVPIRLRSSWGHDRKFRKCLQQTTHSRISVNNECRIPAQLYPADTRGENTHISCAV